MIINIMLNHYFYLSRFFLFSFFNVFLTKCGGIIAEYKYSGYILKYHRLDISDIKDVFMENYEILYAELLIWKYYTRNTRHFLS